MLGFAVTSSPGSRSGPCSCRRRWPTPRSPASRRSSGSTRPPPPDPLRRLRQLAAPGHRADGCDRCALGGRGRRPRRRRLGCVRRAHGDPRARRRVLALVAGLLRFGFLASFISEPVLKGFIIGLALTIIVGQLPKLFGVEKGEGDFFEQLRALAAGSSATTSGLTLLVGRLLAGPRGRAPGAGAGGSRLAGRGAARDRRCEQSSTSTPMASRSSATIEGGLPTWAFPTSGPRDYLDLAAAAVGVMLIGFAEGFGAAKSYAAGTTTRSTRTASSWAWAPPTSAPACRAG